MIILLILKVIFLFVVALIWLPIILVMGLMDSFISYLNLVVY